MSWSVESRLVKKISFATPSFIILSQHSSGNLAVAKNISDTLGYRLCATFLFVPHFDVICELLLNRRTATCYPIDF